MTITVTDDYRLDGGATLSVKNQNGFDLTGDGAGHPSLTIAGVLDVTGDQKFGAVSGIYVESAGVDRATVTVEEGGEVHVSDTADIASAYIGVFKARTEMSSAGTLEIKARYDGEALFFGAGGSFANTGTVSVVSSKFAKGIVGAEVLNQGQIEVLGKAVVVGVDGSLDNAGTLHVAGAEATGVTARGDFHNAGSILVEPVGAGDYAVGVDVWFEAKGVSFVNEGSIVVDGRDGVGVGISVTGGGGQLFENAGEITAETAFAILTSGPQRPAIVLHNSGQITGAVSLGQVGDEVRNTGTITGDVFMGTGNDVFAEAGKGRMAGVVFGDAGADMLGGGKQANHFDGGAGADALTGGGGADTLTGGAGADHFIYLGLSDSKGARADLITDLGGTDVIDLSAIDADTGTDGDQAFHLVAALGGHAGEAALVYGAKQDLTRLLLDVDGDGQADATITISGDHHDFTGLTL